MIDAETYHRVCESLFTEARLLDDGKFEDWLAMLSEEIEYTAQIQSDLAHDASPPQHSISYLAENFGTLSLRVAKIRTGLQQTELPASRTVRLVNNVVVISGVDDLEVQSAFMLYRNHRQRDVEILAGHRDDVWVEVDGQLKLKRRVIRFASNVLPTKSLSLFY